METKKLSLGSSVTVADELPQVPSVAPAILTPDTAGPFAVKLLRGYLPCDAGDVKFHEICEDWLMKGTTCGFLPHWLMWRLGYRNPNVVNRHEPADGLRYLDGKNISMIWNAGRSPFVPFKEGTLPEPGDIGFISNGRPITEHVFVFLSCTSTPDLNTYQLEVAEAGQVNAQGRQCARIHNPRMSNGVIGGRKLVGWISLRNLQYTKPALLVGPDGSPLA